MFPNNPCECPMPGPCSFAVGAYDGYQGDIAQQYKCALWNMTSGHECSLDHSMSSMQRFVNLACGVDDHGKAVTPVFGLCGLVWTCDVLCYRLMQGSPHTAAALGLCAPFVYMIRSPSHPIITALHRVIGEIARGTIPDHILNPPHFDVVYHHSIRTENVRPDVFMPEWLRSIWSQWARRLAMTLHGDNDAWKGWQYGVIASIPQRPGSFVEPIHYTAIAPQYIFWLTPVDPVIFATTPAANTDETEANNTASFVNNGSTVNADGTVTGSNADTDSSTWEHSCVGWWCCSDSTF